MYTKLISVEEYFEDHPEYFCLYEGKRRKVHPDGFFDNTSNPTALQLCLSNTEMQDIFAQKVIARIKNSDDLDSVAFSISPNDGSPFCDDGCAGCKAMDDPADPESMSNRVCAFSNIIARKVAQEEYADSGVEFESRIVDNMCMQLVQKPELYDVLVLPNLYGDIVSDLAAGLVGGLGVAPGMNVGPNGAVFEATHGSAPKYKGQNKVNPTAVILSAMLMLRHLKEHEAADRLENAVAAVIAEGKDVTYDMKPHRDDPTAVGTQEMADAICAKMA